MGSRNTSAPLTASVADLARLTGLTPRTVRDLLISARPTGTRGPASTYDLATVMPLFTPELGRLGEGGDADMGEWRRRRERAGALLVETELAQRRGDLVQVEEVGRKVERAYSTVRARMLAIPTRAAPLIAPDRRHEVAGLLDGMVREALDALVEELSTPVEQPLKPAAAG